MTLKAATLCSGFDGVGIGMQAAGLKHAWGIEYDDQIASVARLNGFNTHTLNLLDADPSLFEPVDVLHASPPCPNFSVAKAGAKETDDDLALARKVVAFIEVIKPRIFTLENVWAYRKSESWAMIAACLTACGYWTDFQHVNFADLGVPQTRKRMIVRAIRGGFIPHLPKKEPWQGWYQAIEDIIPTLPPSEFAPWQLVRLPMEQRESFIAAQGKYDDKLPISEGDSPAFTITANSNQMGIKAFIIPGDNASNDTIRYEDEPTTTVGNTNRVGNIPRAFIVNAWMINSENAGQEWGGTREGEEPAMTISTTSKPKAFIVDGKLSTSGENKTLQIHPEGEPFGTVVSSHAAFRDTRAWLSQGRVVKMTPRALARFQSFPDWYQLPEKAALACKGIGNAVPPLGMEKIYKTLVNI